MGIAVGMAVVMAEDTVVAVVEVLGGIIVATVTVMVMVITADTDTVGGVILIAGAILTGGAIGGAIPIGGVILTGGATLTGGVTLTIPLMVPTMILTTILILMKAMKGRRCLQKGLLPRRDQYSNLLIGNSVRTLRVTTLM